MRILMVVTYLNVGGTETHVLSLARSLKKMGHTVGIASKGGPFVRKFLSSGITVHKIPYKANIQQMAQAIGNVVKANGYQIIHAHDSESFSIISKYQSDNTNPCCDYRTWSVSFCTRLEAGL